jgi:hypothetical protein
LHVPVAEALRFNFTRKQSLVNQSVEGRVQWATGRRADRNPAFFQKQLEPKFLLYIALGDSGTINRGDHTVNCDRVLLCGRRCRQHPARQRSQPPNQKLCPTLNKNWTLGNR